MTVLVLGGQGKTSKRLSGLLADNNVPFAIASRSRPSGGQVQHVRFDWLDESTYDLPFDTASDITAVYMVSPPILEPFPPMKAFIDHARRRGVKRFVLLSATIVPKGGDVYGKVHEYLESIDVEYGVLRPTWFMGRRENFSEAQHVTSILKEGKIYSATQGGKIPFVSADDIAAVAFHLVTDVVSHNTDRFVRGPELLTYDEVAKIISETIGRPVEHVNLTTKDLEAKFTELDLPQDYAQMLAALDGFVAQGSEAHLDDVVLRVTGRAPKSFSTFASENRSKWLT